MLGLGPLRTKQLTERIRGFSDRSVYRCLRSLENYGLIERYEDSGLHSKVLLRLTEPLGRNLFRLLRHFEATPWKEMRLLGELWEAGVVDELSRGPKSLMELLAAPHDLTYHQVKRRTGMAVDCGLLEGSSHKGNSRLYELSDRGRHRMALLADVGRWRHRYLVPGDAPGLALEEMATILRAALPLVQLPANAGMRVDLIVTGALEYGQREVATVPGLVGREGVVRFDPQPEREANGSASATINTWFAALLDGHRGRIRVRGELGLVDRCMTQLHDSLWSGGPA
ncbi:MAG TPA: winged helix-turn-helix transcriptional regulator [Solirubrobacterales bacterium]|nr:winged helix-turn-helix transcriptional regulator [Solirubrobacterales bacterium]